MIGHKSRLVPAALIVLEELPNLVALGKMVAIDVITGATDTKAGWTQIMTGCAPCVFLATNDMKVNRDGTREDIAPTVLKRLGVDLTKLEPKLDGIALDEPAPERKAPPEPAQPKRTKRKK